MGSDEEYSYNEFMESSSSVEEEYYDETAMVRLVLADSVRVEEHVLNYKDSTIGWRFSSSQRS